jgi:mono/diheme cytochrome c family protein
VHTAVLALAVLGSGSLILTGQEPVRPAAFSAAQAEAGRAAYEKSCGQCHTPSLRGRKGEEGEIPPLASLPPAYQKFIGPRMRVPPLVGKGFAGKYGKATVSDLYTLFRGAADSTPVSELHMSDDTLVNITAYILQSNGAKSGSQVLTKTADATMQSLVE